MAVVTGVDFENKEVLYLQGSMRRPQRLRYDHLVLAMGQRTQLDRFPGFAEHSLCMRNLADAHELAEQSNKTARTRRYH